VPRTCLACPHHLPGVPTPPTWRAAP